MDGLPALDPREAHSAASLPEGSALRRALREPQRERSAEFLAAFEDRVLVYDCFWHADGDRIVMVGPPPMNLLRAFEAASFRAEPSGKPLILATHASLSQAVFELIGPPPDTTHVRLGGSEVVLPVMANHAAELAGRRVLFSMNKDNELDWVRHWARHHQRHHGTDTVILFDNGSTRYGVDELRAALAGVPGIVDAIVPSWPYRFGARDDALKRDPYWAHFVQNAAMSVVLRRYGTRAKALLNVDVDELAAPAQPDLYERAERSRTGLLTFRGRWVEAIADAGAPNDHRAYSRVLADETARSCGNFKWVLDPKRRWVRNPRVQPYWHWIEGRPLLAKQRLKDQVYWHFRGINSNWKETRTAPRPGDTVVDAALAACLADS